ncbi:hypothetical protein [Nocardiopsis algeriensis]|uniref:Uncharacterized protein n=1 Tax=Nocardiopsis algeriensis TaxID=1478215 RepID=A0A841IVP4_9ACTN|nr:hypothetical protein [Nocardiopsis algeriensis]MBB6120268.1 hypothetical protein [Nocardiopsis algeriensis]
MREWHTGIAEKLSRVEWSSRSQRRRSQARLVQEYLRRSALWSLEIGGGGWPFFDIAESIDPGIRATDEAISEALDILPSLSTFYVRRTVEWSIHFSVLRDSKKDMPNLPCPFEPLLTVYYRGDFINYTPDGLIEVDGINVPRGNKNRYAKIKPFEHISPEALEKFDKEYEERKSQ